MDKVLAFILTSFAAFYLFADASSQKTTVKYYLGFVETKHLPTGQSFPQQEIMVKKVIDPENKKIIEIACAPFGPAPGAQYGVSPIYMDVNKDKLQISDSESSESPNVDGVGTLLGTPWSWESLTFDMKTNFGGNISWVKDVNFVSGRFLYGTKYIFINQGTDTNPVKKDEAELLMNLKMMEVSQEEFTDSTLSKGCSIN